VTGVAVIAHRGKTLGGGLDELRAVLAARGIDPLWYEVSKSKRAPGPAREAVERGAGLVFVWGGDGMVQRCLDTLAGASAAIAIIPAGTANLLATNLGIPKDVEAAVDIGLHGNRRPLDLGVVNGERFAVMAGTGFDALMIRDADAGLKDKVGRLAYVATGLRHVRERAAQVRIDVDKDRWFKGKASCVLLGNVGQIIGGLTAFEDARPDDGVLEVGLVTADRPLQWGRVLARMMTSSPDQSPFVQMTRGKRIDVRLKRKQPYELDGGDRKKTDRLKVRVDHHAVTVCTPAEVKT